MHRQPKIVFMGSPAFALPTLETLVNLYEVVGVATQPDRPAGRGRRLSESPVKQLAFEKRLEVIQPRRLSEPEAMQQLSAWRPDLIVVAAFGQILKPAVLEMPPFGCLNVHASLLPRWRGASPIQAAILHGDVRTGVSIMKMDAGLDTGPVIARRQVVIGSSETAGELSERLADLGAALLAEVLPGYLDGSLKPRPQDEGASTYAGMLKKKDGRLDLEAPARELARKVRAFNPWPGAFIDWQGQPLKIHMAHAGAQGSLPGSRLAVGGQPALGTADGILVLDEVQPAGKKPMSGEVFLNGARGWESS